MKKPGLDRLELKQRDWEDALKDDSH